MKRFAIVLKYELKEYFTNKVFMGLTVVLALLGVAALFLPRFVDMSGLAAAAARRQRATAGRNPYTCTWTRRASCRRRRLGECSRECSGRRLRTRMP